MKDAHSLYNNKFQRAGRTFGQCLTCAWRWEKDAVKVREEKEAKLQEVIAQSWAEHEANKGKANPYNDVNIPASAYYTNNNSGLYGSHYVGD